MQIYAFWSLFFFFFFNYKHSFSTPKGLEFFFNLIIIIILFP